MKKEIRRIPLNLDYLNVFKTLQLEQVGEIMISVMSKYANDEPLDIHSEAAKAYALVWCNDINIAISRQCEKSQMYQENGRLGGKRKAENMRKDQETGNASHDVESEQQAEATAQPSDDIPCAEVEIVDPHSFDVFWNLYKYKRGKKPALRAWNKLKDSDKAAAIEAVPKYLAYLDYKRATGREQEQMHASTYLNQSRWEDDYTITTPINTNYHGSNNRQSYKEAEFERNARTVIENLQAAERGELAYLSPFNPPSGQR